MALTWHLRRGQTDFQTLGVSLRTRYCGVDYTHPVLAALGINVPNTRWTGRGRYLERLYVVSEVRLNI